MSDVAAFIPNEEKLPPRLPLLDKLLLVSLVLVEQSVKVVFV